MQQIRLYLNDLQAEYPFELQIVDVGEQPYLAEHFKLVATPALIKIYPEPRQTLAGSNLIEQLKNWWTRWQEAVANELQPKTLKEDIDSDRYAPTDRLPIRSVADSVELIQLADEIFRLKRENEKLL